MALLRVFFSWVRSFCSRRSPRSRQWQKGLLSLLTSSRYSCPAASPVTFKAARCMRSCRSISQKQLPSWGQSCSRASRARTNNALSGSSSQNSLRALTASERSATSAATLRVVSAVESAGRTVRIADAYCDDGKRFVVSADEKLTAYCYFLLTNRNATARIRI